MGEHPTGTAHQEDQDAQSYAGRQHRETYLQLRPLQLLLTRQAIPRALRRAACRQILNQQECCES